MKNISITSQLILLSLSVVLLASAIFTAVTISGIVNFAEAEVYSRLQSYATIVKTSPGTIYPGQENMDTEFYILDDYQDYRSESLNSMISDEQLYSIINSIDSRFEAQRGGVIVKDRIQIEGNQYYYIFMSNSDFSSYIFMITNSNYVSYVVKNVSLQTIIIFLLVIMLTIFLVFIWSNRFVSRIKSIQAHITNLPKSKYEKVYEDNSSDEIGELSKSIELMRIDIKENEKTKQEMLQNISHDFKTPIAVIKTYAEAELDGVVTNDEAYRTIIEQAEILKKKVNRLLQYNSLEYLTKDKEFEEIDIKALVLDVVSAYKYQTNIKFELDLADDVFFSGYRENLYTVIANILDNGLRYAKTMIKIVLRKDRLRIYNDGDPIDSQFLNSVFKPYEKGSNGNFGLGMSIVKKTLDFFGLNLSVKNEESGGVSFIITKD